MAKVTSQGVAIFDSYEKTNIYKKWIDGKIVYRKVVKILTGESINTWYILLEDNIDIPLSIQVLFYKTGQYYPNDKSFSFYCYEGKLYYQFNDNWRANSECYFIIEYTKNKNGG